MAESKTLLEKLLDKANWIFTFLAAAIPTIAAISAGSIENIFKQENAFNTLTVILLSFSTILVYTLTRHFYEKKEKKILDLIQN